MQSPILAPIIIAAFRSKTRSGMWLQTWPACAEHGITNEHLIYVHVTVGFRLGTAL